jgi:hypothetical protein
VLGLQFHLETTPASADAMITRCRDELLAGGAYVQTEDTLRDAPRQTYATINALMASVLNALVTDRTVAPAPAWESDTVKGAVPYA